MVYISVACSKVSLNKADDKGKIKVVVEGTGKEFVNSVSRDAVFGSIVFVRGLKGCEGDVG